MRKRCISLPSPLGGSRRLAAVIVIASTFLALGSEQLTAADTGPYLDQKPLVARIKELAREHKGVIRAEEVCETAGKNELWRLELGTGSNEQRSRRPSLLVVAGIDGNDLAGTTATLAWVENLARQFPTNSQISNLLHSTTIHVWPRMNPDAARKYFSRPRIETSTNDRPDDTDHDGLSDEDGPEDINGDGAISWMRVEDPDGEWMLDPLEPRLLLKADRLKGERGTWKLFSEGRDNDGDELWNEDAIGGVNFNRNFPYGYKFFGDGAGRHQVSETETRALAEFVIAHPEIGVVFSFGAADNLSQTPKSEAPKRPPTALHDDDAGWYRELGKAWREQLGLKKELPGNSEPGTFADWMYFHRGRLSLAARAWFPQLQVELARSQPKQGDESKKESGGDGEAKPDKSSTEKKAKENDPRNEDERAFLKWIDQSSPDSFLPWKSIEHPDFPGKRVEVGGFAPYAKVLPPAKQFNELTARHGAFLTDLAGRLPRVAIRRFESKALGESVFEITIQVENSGRLPTALAQGSLSREVHSTRVKLNLERSTVLSGDPTTSIGALQPGAAKEVRWIIRAKETKRLKAEVTSMIAGRAEAEIELKEGK